MLEQKRVKLAVNSKVPAMLDDADFAKAVDALLADDPPANAKASMNKRTSDPMTAQGNPMVALAKATLDAQGPRPTFVQFAQVPQHHPFDAVVFSVGQHVMVQGVQKKPELNGRVASVLTQLYNGRFPVRLLDGAEEEVRLKPENLSRTAHSPKEGQVEDEHVMRFGEWFPIQAVLDQTINSGDAVGNAFAALDAMAQADVLAGRRRLAS